MTVSAGFLLRRSSSFSNRKAFTNMRGKRESNRHNAARDIRVCLPREIFLSHNVPRSTPMNKDLFSLASIRLKPMYETQKSSYTRPAATRRLVSRQELSVSSFGVLSQHLLLISFRGSNKCHFAEAYASTQTIFFAFANPNGPAVTKQTLSGRFFVIRLIPQWERGDRGNFT